MALEFLPFLRARAAWTEFLLLSLPLNKLLLTTLSDGHSTGVLPDSVDKMTARRV